MTRHQSNAPHTALACNAHSDLSICMSLRMHMCHMQTPRGRTIPIHCIANSAQICSLRINTHEHERARAHIYASYHARARSSGRTRLPVAACACAPTRDLRVPGSACPRAALAGLGSGGARCACICTGKTNITSVNALGQQSAQRHAVYRAMQYRLHDPHVK